MSIDFITNPPACSGTRVGMVQPMREPRDRTNEFIARRQFDEMFQRRMESMMRERDINAEAAALLVEAELESESGG